MEKPINSPFRYAGGKFYARKLILEHIPAHQVYVEPFVGGGSIFFAKPKVETNILNDADKELINVYKVIKKNPRKLIKFLQVQRNESRIPNELIAGLSEGDPLPAKKELHSFFKNEYLARTNIERAGRWYYLNRTSYSGIMNHQNMYFGYGDKFSMQPKNWPKNILRTSEKLQDTIIENKDFEKIIDESPDNSFLFIDPPYFNAAQDKFYTHSFSKKDHLRLHDCIRRNNTRLKIFITYDNTEEIRELYQWLPYMYDKEWNYCIQRTDDQKNKSDKKGERYKGKELFILNYEAGD